MKPAPTVASSLLERERELSETSAALERALAGHGGVLIVEGPAGIGKTQLARAVDEQARASGMLALWSRGVEMERELSYGLVRQLFEPVVRRADSRRRELLLEGTARLALPVIEPVVGSGVDVTGMAVLHGLYWLVSNLAEERPLLVTFDDAQWSDEESLGFVQYLTRRIDDLPVLAVLTIRRPDPVSPDGALSAIALHQGVVTERLKPLTPSAAADLIRRELADDADDEFCAACHRATGGNPFLLTELVREIEAEHIAPTAPEAPSIEQLAPETVSQAVLLRLSRLSPESRRIALSLSVLAGSAELRDAATLAQLDAEQAARAVDELAAAGIVAEGRPIEFLHSLLRQAVYRDAPEGERRILHRRAAALLSASGEPSQVASHLLNTEPLGDEWVVTSLRSAAKDALTAGAPTMAISCLNRALAEPPPDSLRPEVLMELGLAQARAGDKACTETLARALDAGVEPESRAEIALELARTLWYLHLDPEGALEVLSRIERDALEPDAALRIEAQDIEFRVGYVDGLGGIPLLREEAHSRLQELAPRAEPPRPATSVLLGTLARTRLEKGGNADRAAELALEALEAGEEALLFSSAHDVLVWTDHYEEASRLLEGFVAEGRRRGDPYVFGVAIVWRGVLGYRMGDLLEAEADCSACIDVIAALGVGGVTYPHAWFGDVLIERDLDAADEFLASVAPNATGSYSEFFLDTRGRLRTAQGRLDEAAEDLRFAGELAAFQRSPAILAWRSNLAIVLAQLGRRDEGIELAREETELARNQGAHRAIGIALRGMALAEGGAEGLQTLREAVDVLEDSAARLEYARALTDLGAALRRAGQRNEARGLLGRALDVAHRCGAKVLERRAREELLAAGARPRRHVLTGVEALTARERRVVHLASGGMTNRQIAQALFVSVWTVARHLTNAYRKLGIEGRDELPNALQRQVEA